MWLFGGYVAVTTHVTSRVPAASSRVVAATRQAVRVLAEPRLNRARAVEPTVEPVLVEAPPAAHYVPSMVPREEDVVAHPSAD